MCAEPRRKLPSDLSRLARIAADPGQSEEFRNRAFEELLPGITALARRVATRFPLRCRDEFTAQAGSVVWTRLQHFDSDKGQFEDWCWMVLYHDGVSDVRRSTAGLVQPAAGDRDMATAVDPVVDAQRDAEADEVLRRFRELRQALDRLAWPPKRGVHYFAVLLLQLRLASARCISSDPPAATGDPSTSLVERIVWCVPWSAEEAGACVRSDWPSLAVVWARLAEELCRPPHRVDAPALCRVLTPLLDKQAPLTADVWNHWVHRAKKEARCRLNDEETWTRCFGRLLPDR